MNSHRVARSRPQVVALTLSLAFAAGRCAPIDGIDSTGNSADSISVCPGSHTQEGIDVSHWDGTVNWSAVRHSGRVFAYASVGDGYFEDPTFGPNWSGMRAAGLLRGAYQYFEPADDPVRQANILISRVGGVLHDGDLPPVLDVETTGGQSPSTIASRIRTWVDHVQAATGRVPIIYTGMYFWNDNVGSSGFTHNPLWLASYGVSCPGTPRAWNHWTIWQYTSSARVPGISGDVDANKFDGTLAELQALANGGGSGDPGLANPPEERVGRNTDGRLELFARGSDNAVWHIWQTAAGGGWSQWGSMGGETHANPVVASDQNGSLEVFVIGTNGALYRKHQTPSWTPNWESLGGTNFAGEPAAVLDRDGLLHVFVRDSGGALHHFAQSEPNGAFGSDESVGGTSLSLAPAAALEPDGSISVFVRGAGNAVFQAHQTGTNWDWQDLGGVVSSSPAVAANADGHLELFARGTSDQLYHKWESRTGGWTAWERLGAFATASGASVARNSDGRLEVVLRATDDSVWHIWQTAPNGTWSSGASFGGSVTETPGIVANHDGRLEVFARGTDDALYHLWERAAGGWSGWADLNGNLASF